jgi:hypothetical protein
MEQLLSVGLDLDAGNPARPAQCHGVECPRRARLEALRRPGGDVEAESVCEGAVELEGYVHVREVDVRTDLDRAVARVHEHEPNSLGLAPVGVELDSP